MDSLVKRIRPKDYELSTVQDNLANAVDQLLSGKTSQPSQIILSPKLQQVYGPGTPYSIQQPALQVNGDTQNTNGYSVVLGNPATATAAQNPCNVQLTGTLTGTGAIVTTGAVSGATVSGNTVTSAAGFKNTICVGSYWNTNYQANSLGQLSVAVVNANGGGVGLTPFVMKWTHSGSVVGMTMNQSGPVSGTNFLYIYKNFNVFYTWNMGSGNNNSAFSLAVAKSVIYFAAGDVLTCFVGNGASGNNQVLAHLTLEMSA